LTKTVRVYPVVFIIIELVGSQALISKIANGYVIFEVFEIRACEPTSSIIMKTTGYTLTVFVNFQKYECTVNLEFGTFVV
jgi:hypothetical protein